VIERAARTRRCAQKELDLGAGNEKGVPEFLESAAAPGKLADRTETSHFGVELKV
jgi:hypothetical protein